MKKLLGRLSIGSWITLGHPAIAEIMATAGFDWLAVDLEHSAINIGQAEELIRTIDLKGTPALVRLSSNNAEQIKRVMDSGAQGVIVPMVKSSAEAVAAVEATKYPPVGTRIDQHAPQWCNIVIVLRVGAWPALRFPMHVDVPQNDGLALPKHLVQDVM